MLDGNEGKSDLKLTKFTDYSFRVLIYLGLQESRLVTIHEMAEHYDISKNHLMKIIQLLGKQGIVETVRGKSGGVRLARPASEIRIGKVVRQVEGDMAVVRCMGPLSEKCSISGVCALEGYFTEATEAFLSVLDRYTLDDVLNNRASLSHALSLPSQGCS